MAKTISTLNGYEVVDKTARTNIDTKQNKVLYGSSSPSSSTGTNGDLYVISGAETEVNITNIKNIIYPVGSVYISVNSTSPATLFGGTWEQLKDRFLLAAGDTYKSGNTGGEATHTLTVDEMPSHNHTYNKTLWAQDTGYGQITPSGSTGANKANIMGSSSNYTGGGKAHNNMPPYLTVYMWKRTA